MRYIRDPRWGLAVAFTVDGSGAGAYQVSIFEAGVRPAPMARLRDLIELGKPRLSMMVIFTSAVGMWVARAGMGFGRAAAFVLATSCLMAAANTLNCWIEIELDGRMVRTRNRPLPAGRLEPRTALISGVTLVVLSLTGLSLATNLLTTSLGAIAVIVYVLAYTPLKRVTPWALLVGAVPGAIPPLMGWTAATGSIGTAGLFLFGVLYFWQLPHFVAISLYLEEDFRRAGFPVLPIVYGHAVAQRYIAAYTVLLVVHCLAAQWLGLAGFGYTAVAAAMGLGFLILAARGLGSDPGERWAKQIFGYSLIYLPLILTILALSAG